MAQEQFSNRQQHTLQTGLAASTQGAVDTVTVDSTAGYPVTGQWRMQVDTELLLITGAPTGNAYPCLRGMEGTGAVIHSAGTAVVLNPVTAGSITNIGYTNSPTFGIGTTAPNVGGFGGANAAVLTTYSPTASALNEMATGAADASGLVVGGLVFSLGSVAQANAAVAYISSETLGATAGNRGGIIRFWTKPDGGGIAERMRLTNVGVLSFAMAASPRLQGGTVDFGVMNNAGNANNLLISDAGQITTRGGVGIGGANTTFTGPTMTALVGPVNSQSQGPHMNFGYAADADPALQFLTMAHDNVEIGLDTYWDGNNQRSSSPNGSFRLLKTTNAFQIAGGVAAKGAIVTLTTFLSVGTGGLLTLSEGTADNTVYNHMALVSGGGGAQSNVIRQTNLSVGPAATDIADIAGWGSALVIVHGSDSLNKFVDLVLWTSGAAIVVIASATVAGAPPTRTYTTSGATQLKLALSAGSTHTNCLIIAMTDR